MKLNRRQMFAAFAAAPVIAKAAPKEKQFVPVEYGRGFMFTPMRSIPAAELSPEILAWMKETHMRQERNLRMMFDDAFYKGGE